MKRTAESISASPRAPAIRPGVILAFVCLGQFMVFMDVSIVNLALPSIQGSLHMSDVSLNYVITAYGTVLGGLLLLGGRLADTFGRRRLLQSGLVLFALASLGSGLAHTGSALIATRGAQGLGSALITPAALSILTNTFAEGPARTKALGVWGSLTGIASIIGVILGGVLASGPGWRWIFWINVPIGLAGAVLAPSLVPGSKASGRRQRFDTAGAAALTGGLLLLIFTLGQATRAGWASGRTISSLLGVAVLLAAFLLIESRATSPIVPLPVFRLKTVRVANLSAVIVFGMFSGLFFFASIFMQRAYGYSPLEAGLAYLPLAVCVAAGAGLASGLITKIAPRPVLIAGLTTTVVGLLLLSRAPLGGSYALDLLPAFVSVGLGCGTCYVTLQVAAFSGVTGDHVGVGAGLISTSQETGGALGLAVIATIAYSGIGSALAKAGSNPHLLAAAQAQANHHAFLVASGFGAIAIVFAATLMPRPARSTQARRREDEQLTPDHPIPALANSTHH